MINRDDRFWHIPDLTAGFYKEQILDFITSHILKGILKPHEPLPPYRQIASLLKVHRNTIGIVYRILCNQGWLYTINGHGTFVSDTFPGYENVYMPIRRIEKSPLPLSDRIESKQDMPRPPEASFCKIAFDTPGPEYFPLWHHYHFTQQHVKRYNDARQIIRVIDLRGMEYRDAAFRHLDNNRHFAIHADCMEIFMGRKHTLNRILKCVLSTGDRLLNTSPKDALICDLLQSSGLQIHNLNSADPDFIDKLRVLLEHSRIKALYIRPQCSYPESTHLNPEQCETLVALAKKYQFFIIEEDDYHEFWYQTIPFKELIRHDHAGHVIYVGAFSLLTPYLQQTRTVVAASEIIDALRNVDVEEYEGRDLLAEKTYTDLFNSKKIYRYINRMKKVKKKHFDEIWFEMDNYLRQGVKILKPSSGLSLWLRFPDAETLKDSMDLITASDQEIPYMFNSPRPGPGISDIRLGFGSWERYEAQEAAKILYDKFNS